MSCTGNDEQAISDLIDGGLHEQEKLTCTNCNGSGEGMYDGTKCTMCKGSGVEYVLADVEGIEDE